MTSKHIQTAILLAYHSTVKQFCERYPAFTEGGIRHNIFYKDTNGLAESGAIVRNGRRILINEEKFFAWLESENNQGAQNA